MNCANGTMICHECSTQGRQRPAVAPCHHCSVGLCSEHAHVVADPITARYPVCATIILPLKARVMLCTTSREALQQPREAQVA